MVAHTIVIFGKLQHHELFLDIIFITPHEMKGPKEVPRGMKVTWTREMVVIGLWSY